MSNLLPKERLQTAWSRFRNRLLLVGALVLLGTALFSALSLIPAHIALRVEKNIGAKQDAEKLEATADADRRVQIERDEIARAKVLLDTVIPIVSATSSPTEAIDAALSLSPQGVSVDRVTFIADEGGKIIIGGISQGRESINQYKEALWSSGYFRSVVVPVGALVGAESGPFSITLSGVL